VPIDRTVPSGLIEALHGKAFRESNHQPIDLVG